MDQFILHCFEDGLVQQQEITDRTVLEVGSGDVNGSVRHIIEARLPRKYMGVDIKEGPGVDKVLNCEDLLDTFGYNSFDVVISTELLEHVKDWKSCILNMVGVLTINGVIVITTRSPGFPYHGHPDDYWRFTPDLMYQIMEMMGLRVIFCLQDIQYPGVIVKAQKRELWGLPVPNMTAFDLICPYSAPAL